MKQFFGFLGFLLLLAFVLFGKSAIRSLLQPKPVPTMPGIALPISSTRPTTLPATTRPKGIPIKIGTIGVKVIRPTTAPAQAEPVQQSRDPEGTDLFESLKLSKPKTLDVPTYSPQRELDVPASLKLVRAQPCVYKILEYGDLEMRIPDKVNIDDDALMRAYAADGHVPNGNDRANDPQLTQYLWAKLIEEPNAFLSFDGEQAAQKFENELMASGTGFLISRDGIVLTNAHVIGDMADEKLTNDPLVLAGLIGPACDGFMKETIKLFGGPPTPETAPQVATTLLQWFASNGRMTGKFRRAEIVLQFKKKPKSDTILMDPETLFNGKPQPIVAPLEVLFKGEELPGKDVAILRASEGDFDPIDRAICLPLGDSEDVLAGTRVQALGFPGIAFNEHMMDQTAAYRVSAQDGQVANTKRMSGGYDAIEMTADINHGDSGGPVINVLDGQVIGLNVGAAQEHATGHTLAIPINVAKDMLKDLNIEVDPGPTTALWIDALAQYDAKDYERCVATLSRLVRLQAKWTELDGTMLKDISGDWAPEWDAAANPYIVDLLKRAKSKLNK